MKHMKLSDKERELTNPVAAHPSKEEYPYGLRLNLGPDELKKLGISELPGVGDSFVVDAKAVVRSIHASEGEDHSHRSVELQITHLGLEDDGEEKSKKTSRAMYPTMQKGK